MKGDIFYLMIGSSRKFQFKVENGGRGIMVGFAGRQTFLSRWTQESFQCSQMSCQNSRPTSSTTVQVAIKRDSHNKKATAASFWYYQIPFCLRYSQSSYTRDSLLPLFWRWGSLSSSNFFCIFLVLQFFSETWCICDGKSGSIRSEDSYYQSHSNS